MKKIWTAGPSISWIDKTKAMKVFFDTNVILDILDNSREHHPESLYLLQAAGKGAIPACATAQSIIDASYVRTQRDRVPVHVFKDGIDTLCRMISILGIEEEDIHQANLSLIQDYEDAAQLACAERCGCDILVTNDRKYRGYTSLPVYSVREFYERLFLK